MLCLKSTYLRNREAFRLQWFHGEEETSRRATWERRFPQHPIVDDTIRLPGGFSITLYPNSTSIKRFKQGAWYEEFTID